LLGGRSCSGRGRWGGWRCSGWRSGTLLATVSSPLQLPTAPALVQPLLRPHPAQPASLTEALLALICLLPVPVSTLPLLAQAASHPPPSVLLRRRVQAPPAPLLPAPAAPVGNKGQLLKDSLQRQLRARSCVGTAAQLVPTCIAEGASSRGTATKPARTHTGRCIVGRARSCSASRLMLLPQQLLLLPEWPMQHCSLLTAGSTMNTWP
jgi:hypothetical protein